MSGRVSSRPRQRLLGVGGHEDAIALARDERLHVVADARDRRRSRERGTARRCPWRSGGLAGAWDRSPAARGELARARYRSPRARRPGRQGLPVCKIFPRMGSTFTRWELMFLRDRRAVPLCFHFSTHGSYSGLPSRREMPITVVDPGCAADGRTPPPPISPCVPATGTPGSGEPESEMRGPNRSPLWRRLLDGWMAIAEHFGVGPDAAAARVLLRVLIGPGLDRAGARATRPARQARTLEEGERLARERERRKRSRTCQAVELSGRSVRIGSRSGRALLNILGISAFYHDSAAALLRDGDLVAAAHEERFTRKRHDPALPEQAVKYCLDSGGDLDRRTSTTSSSTTSRSSSSSAS